MDRTKWNYWMPGAAWGALLLLLFSWTAGVLTAEAVPLMFNVQGRLTDSQGVNRNGQYNINFKVFTLQSGGTLQWEESQQNINVTNGNFQVLIGSLTNREGGTPVENETLADVFTGAPLFLEITVVSGQDVPLNSEPALVPRIQLVSVPYAVRAGTAESAGSDEPDYIEVRPVGNGAACGLNAYCVIQHNLGARPRRVVVWLTQHPDGSGWAIKAGTYPQFWGGGYNSNGVSVVENNVNALTLRAAETLGLTYDVAGGANFRLAGFAHVYIWR